VAADPPVRRSPQASIGFDVVVSSRTSLAIVDLARAFTSALRETGHVATIVEDRIPPVRDDRATLVIGPHDVYPHLASGDGSGLTASLARSILVCCARPHTPAWSATVTYAAKAGYLFDVSDAGQAAFEDMGLPAHRFQLGYHESFDRWQGQAGRRPLDLVFVGSATPRRKEILAAGADLYAELDVDFRLTEGVASSHAAVPEFVSAVDKCELLAQAKILIDVHPDDGHFFRWLGALDALCNGCVLVSEESVGVAPLVPGRHFLTGSRESLPLLVELLMRDPGRANRIRDEAYRFLRDELPLHRSIGAIVNATAQLPGRPPPGRNFAVPDPSPVKRSNGTAPVPLNDTSESRGAEASAEVTQLLAKQNAVLKKLFFDLRLLRRQVAHVARAVEDPSAPLIDESSTPARTAVEPEVTVVVTVHNYARFVRDALSSVVLSRDVELEIVVVDDASVDGSPDVVRDFMKEHDHFPITLFAQRVNTGVQRARNLAFAHARAPFVFVLDADNVVYPRGVAKLRDALERDPGAGFAYGLIERFSEQGTVGLMGTEAWDPALLAQRSYIDAMALVRVDTWKQVGGYVTDPLLELGWEDYDLWLSLAVAGFHGAHVREIIGRYRVHGVSSLTMTTLDTEELMARLRSRHAPFFAGGAKGAS
jgi:GT2 family glycosyltransferase